MKSQRENSFSENDQLEDNKKIYKFKTNQKNNYKISKISIIIKYTFKSSYFFYKS
jgi:hypothetical protein